MKPASAIGPADQADTYPITGIKDGISSDTVPVRVEVDSWYPPTTETQARQVNLFILALRIFQDMDPEEKLSYFQIAGRLCLRSLLLHTSIAGCANNLIRHSWIAIYALGRGG